MKRIIGVVGPTGVGKTCISVKLAKAIDAEIINCDSVQVYKELNIGSAKIKEEEKENIPHHLFDIKEIDEEYTIYDYQKDAREIIDNTDKQIIFVGGSGLYLRAALYDYQLNTNKIHNDYSKYSLDELYNMALKLDKNLSIDKNNRQRIERFLDKKANNEEIVNDSKPIYDFILIGLTTNRDTLYDRINLRVDKMFEEGLLNEVEELYKKNKNSKILNSAIGYKELIPYIEGKYSLDEAKELIKRNSRRFAKRQYTFFNNQFNVKWFEVNNIDDTLKEILDYLKNN